jgi:hypothetical protein
MTNPIQTLEFPQLIVVITTLAGICCLLLYFFIVSRKENDCPEPVDIEKMEKELQLAKDSERILRENEERKAKLLIYQLEYKDKSIASLKNTITEKDDKIKELYDDIAIKADKIHDYMNKLAYAQNVIERLTEQNEQMLEALEKTLGLCEAKQK